MQCRLCQSDNQTLFKYSSRHYAHAACGLSRWGQAFLGMIPRHQVKQLPYRALVDAGLLQAAITLDAQAPN